MSLPLSSPQNVSGLTLAPPEPGHAHPVQGTSFAAAVSNYHASPTSLAFQDLVRRYLAACRQLAWAHRLPRVHPGPCPEAIVTDDLGATFLIGWAGEDACGANARAGAAAARAAAPESTISNIHAMGAVLYALLTGRAPSDDLPPGRAATRGSDGLPWPPGALARGVPRSLEAVCMKALDPDPAWCYPDMAGLAGDVERFLAGEPVQAERLSLWQEVVCRLTRAGQPARLALAVLLLSAGLVAGAWSYRTLSRQQARDRQENRELTARADQLSSSLREANKRLAQALARDQQSHVRLRQTLALLRALAGRTHPAPGDSSSSLAHKRDTAGLVAEAARLLEPGLSPGVPGARDALLDRLLLGDVYLSLGQGDAAGRLFNAAMSLVPQNADRQPLDPAGAQDLLALRRGLGQAALLRGQPAEAADAFREAVRIAEGLGQASPGNQAALNELARAREQLGRVLLLQDRPDPAAEQADRLLALAEGQLKADPASPQARQHKAAALALKGDILHKDYRLEDALKCYEQATGLLAGADVTSLRQGLDRAAEDCRQGLRAADDLAWALNQTDDGRILRCLWLRTAVLARRGQLAPAAATVEAMRARKPRDAANLYNVACGYALCAATLGAGRPETALAPADRSARQAYIRQAVAALEESVARGYFDLAHMQADPDLTPLRTDPGYRRLEAALRARPAWFVAPGPF